MKVFEPIKEMNIDEFAEWLNENWTHDDDPVITWWNKTYCENCECVKGKFLYTDRETEFAYCEIYNKCRFFPEMPETPDGKQMTKMWLESEKKVD